MNEILPNRDEYYFRLAYADGGLVTEPYGGSSIKRAPPGPIELHIMKNGNAILRIDIPSGCNPIFYRQRSLSMTLGGKVSGPITLDATVFGYGREDGDEIQATLWRLTPEGEAVSATEDVVDHVAIANCVKRNVE